LLDVNETKGRAKALEGMSYDLLFERADAAVAEARSLHADRCAIKDDAKASRDSLRETVIASMTTTDRSITARLVAQRKSRGENFKPRHLPGTELNRVEKLLPSHAGRTEDGVARQAHQFIVS
jgi:hypothetical protein